MELSKSVTLMQDDFKIFIEIIQIELQWPVILHFYTRN
jgi:hypothetical protein